MKENEITMTKQELHTLENILSKAGATFGDLRNISDEDWQNLTSFSFNRFFPSQPTVIKTLLETKGDEQEKLYIKDFLEELSIINAVITTLKDNVEAFRCLYLFCEAFKQATDEYGSEIYNE